MKFKFSPSVGDLNIALLGATSTLKTKEGFFMESLPSFGERRCLDFEKIVRAFLNDDGLAFAHILSAERIQSVFAKHGNLFALDGVYTTAVMVWSFLGQVLRDGKEASCQSAVARVVSYCLQCGRTVPTSDTGDYCKARAKLSEHALRELSGEVAQEMEHAAKQDWRWKSLHPKLIDGFTFTMPDTPKNQKEYPQQAAQLPGVGQPIARVVAVLSLSTACILDAALRSYKGKQTGETSLLRSLLGQFGHGDIAVMDRVYCSYMMIVALLDRGAQVCARKHHTRHTDFRRGKRLAKNDHLIVWKRPEVCPFWMDRSEYDKLPRTLTVRELRYHVVVPGRRTKTLTIITTLLDPNEYSLAEIAELYGFRWNVELDIRSIKSSLNLDHVRCKSPEMVRREFWTTMLGYNLIRTTAAGAALLHDMHPRQISFTSTCQYVLSSWLSVATGSMRGSSWRRYCATLLKQIAECEVANRPGRLEPRLIKKRPKPYKLMQKPREVLRRELRKRCT